MSVTAKALWYIESHLDGELSLEAVADSVGVSRFHLCRAFAASTGNSVAGYARARRLSEAARQLAKGAPDIMAVGLDAGYGSHEAFTRAFRQHFGRTPEQVRAHPGLNGLKLREPVRMQPASIVTLSPRRVVNQDALLIFGLSEHYSCSNAGIPAQWSRFLPHFGHIQGQAGRIAYGVIYNSDDAGNYDYLCGVEVSEFPTQPAEFTRLRIPAQRYAVFEHRDHVSTIANTWKAIWEQGLASAGLQPADGPSFERYGEQFDGRTGLGGVEIFIPIHAA